MPTLSFSVTPALLPPPHHAQAARSGLGCGVDGLSLTCCDSEAQRHGGMTNTQAGLPAGAVLGLCLGLVCCGCVVLRRPAVRPEAQDIGPHAHAHAHTRARTGRQVDGLLARRLGGQDDLGWQRGRPDATRLLQGLDRRGTAAVLFCTLFELCLGGPLLPSFFSATLMYANILEQPLCLRLDVQEPLTCCLSASATLILLCRTPSDSRMLARLRRSASA
jgi:hypothetical protein